MSSLNNDEWLAKRQAEYERRMIERAADTFAPEAQAMWDLHSEVIAEINKLPRSEGGLE